MQVLERSEKAKPDGQLSTEIGRGDNAAMTELYVRHRAELRRHAIVLVRDREVAEDIVQQAFTNTISSIQAGVSIEQLGSWLHRCVRNLCLDHRKRVPAASLDEAAEIGQAECPEEIADLNERCRAVHRAVRKLPENQRSAFVLAEVRGYDYQEIADNMQTSIDSVRQLLFRARRRVRKAVGPETAAMAGPLLRLRPPTASHVAWFEQMRLVVESRMAEWLSKGSVAIERVAQTASDPVVPLMVAGVATASIAVPAVSGKDEAVKRSADDTPALSRLAPGLTEQKASSPSSDTGKTSEAPKSDAPEPATEGVPTPAPTVPEAADGMPAQESGAETPTEKEKIAKPRRHAKPDDKLVVERPARWVPVTPPPALVLIVEDPNASTQPLPGEQPEPPCEDPGACTSPVPVPGNPEVIPLPPGNGGDNDTLPLPPGNGGNDTQPLPP